MKIYGNKQIAIKSKWSIRPLLISERLEFKAWKSKLVHPKLFQLKLQILLALRVSEP